MSSAMMLVAQAQRGAAASPANNFGQFLWWVIALVALGVILFSFLMLLVRRYKRCPSNRVLVIYGKVGGGNTARCIHGGAAFVWPLIQDHAYLSLEPIQIAIPLKDALSAENIRVNVPSVFTVAIGTEPEVMQNAAIRLLGLDTHQITHQAQDIIFGQLRQVIASMHIEDINRDRDKFLSSIQHSLEPELRKVGLVLINVNITDITDESGYIEAIGRKAASQAIQQARGDVADQEKLGEIRVAEADREKQVQVANANMQREIGMRDAAREQSVRVSIMERDQQMGVREAQRDQAVKIAQLEKDQKIAEQQAAYEREIAIKTAERDMRVKTADANALAITGENKAQGAVAGSQAELEVKRAEAYQLAETKKREAEALVQEAQHRAMAKAALAEAERIEAEQRATLEAPARATKAKVVVDAEAEAEKRRIEAEGEARAIFAKLEAEAKGQYEILAKKGEGLSRIIEACGGANQAFQLLLLEHLDTLAHTSAQAISNIKFDKVVVWENGNGDGTSKTSDFLQSLSRTLPPMMQVMKDIGGVDMPDYFARLTPEARGATTNGEAVESVVTVEPKGK
jgi:flotillin